MLSRPLLAALCAALLLAARPLAAQGDAPPAPSWVGDAAAVGVNSMLSGLTAGVLQKARGGSFQDGFTRGMLGGVVIYGGKRVAVQRFEGAGFAGREIAAVGSSMVRNAADAVPTFQRVILPVGPVRVYLDRSGGAPVRVKLDLATAIAAGYAIAEPDLELDASSSLGAGALVFRARDVLIRGHGGRDIGASGITRAGTIYLSDIVGLDYQADLRHERAHVLQYDQLFLTWTDPAEDWLVDRVPGGRTLNRFVDLNLSPLATRGLSEAFKSYYQRPWELEARYLSQR